MGISAKTRDPYVFGPMISEQIAKELGIEPPTYEVELMDVDPKTTKDSVKDNLKMQLGGSVSSQILFILTFNITQPRPAKIVLHVAYDGYLAAVHTILFQTVLMKPIDVETQLGEPVLLGYSRFLGETAASKLNASKKIVERANKLARTQASMGSMTVTIKERVFKLSPRDSDRCTLNVVTLPNVGLISVKLDAKEFCDLAQLIEDIL